MKADLIYPALAGMMIGGALMLFAVGQRDRAGVYVPCAIVESSPEVPAAARDECRRRRAAP